MVTMFSVETWSQQEYGVGSCVIVVGKNSHGPRLHSWLRAARLAAGMHTQRVWAAVHAVPHIACHGHVRSRQAGEARRPHAGHLSGAIPTPERFDAKHWMA